MTQIFLIRHGEAEGNRYRRCQGQTDMPLTKAGREQAAALEARFARVPLDAVYSSDLHRAMETVAFAGKPHGLAPIPDPRLREMSFGVWENLPWGEIDRRWPEQKKLFLTDPGKLNVPGMEDWRQVQQRYARALGDIARRHEGGTVAVGGHGMAIRLFLAYLRGVPSERISEVTLPGNTAVSRLLWEDGQFTIDYDNDTSHLPAPPREPMRTIPGKSGQSWDLRFTPFDLAEGRERYIDAYRDAWRFAHGSLQGFDESSCFLAAESYACDDPRAVTAAWRGEDFAGLLTLDLRRGRRWGEGWIAFLWVSPEMRGHGCGMQLLGEAVALYRGLGRRALRLSVAPSNPAVAFYRRAGFVRVDTQPGAIEPLAVMELAL